MANHAIGVNERIGKRFPPDGRSNTVFKGVGTEADYAPIWFWKHGKTRGSAGALPSCKRSILILSAQMPFGLEAPDGLAAFIKCSIVKPCNPLAPQRTGGFIRICLMRKRDPAFIDPAAFSSPGKHGAICLHALAYLRPVHGTHIRIHRRGDAGRFAQCHAYQLNAHGALRRKRG